MLVLCKPQVDYFVSDLFKFICKNRVSGKAKDQIQVGGTNINKTYINI